MSDMIDDQLNILILVYICYKNIIASSYTTVCSYVVLGKIHHIAPSEREIERERVHYGQHYLINQMPIKQHTPLSDQSKKPVSILWKEGTKWLIRECDNTVICHTPI